MSYFGELLRNLQRNHPDADPDALVDAVIVGVESFAWMKDGVTYVGSCGSKLRDQRGELEAVRRSLKEAKEVAS